MIIGIDEVGRGCWAGPLVACAVSLADGMAIEGLKDSKKLNPKQREKLSEAIRASTSHIGIGWVAPSEVDDLGITEAVRAAMQRAVDLIDASDTEIIIDGNINYLSHLENTQAIVKADDSIPAVSAASIIAKVARDQYMYKIASDFPEYGFESHVGYGTKKHIAALRQFGVTVLHRKSYKPVKQAMVANV